MSFKGIHFPKDIILMGVRCYVVYPLSTCHVAELMQERGISVDHSTVNRWVIKYCPPLGEAFHCRKRLVWVSWPYGRDVYQGAGCEFSGVPTLPTLAMAEVKSGSRV